MPHSREELPHRAAISECVDAFPDRCCVSSIPKVLSTQPREMMEDSTSSTGSLDGLDWTLRPPVKLSDSPTPTSTARLAQYFRLLLLAYLVSSNPFRSFLGVVRSESTILTLGSFMARQQPHATLMGRYTRHTLAMDQDSGAHNWTLPSRTSVASALSTSWQVYNRYAALGRPEISQIPYTTKAGKKKR
jgi:hypothetical protein